MRECPECGTLVSQEHGICPSCGAGLQDETRKCDQCRETIAASAETCPACGHLAVPDRCDRHPDRPAPGRCALCGRRLCSECEAGGRYHLCDEHAEIPIMGGWAQVLSVPGDLQAGLIEDNLRAEGIDSRVLSKKDQYALPVGFGDLARVRIMVPTYAYQEAERVLAAHSDAGGDVSFGCPHCGEPNEEGQRECGACGKPLA